MEQIIAFPVVAALSACVFATALVAVVVAERRSRWLLLECAALLAVESALLAVAFGRAAPWMQAIDALGVLLCVLAPALAFATPRPLTRWAEACAEGGDPLRAATARRREDGR
jgi:hypothetical protein